MISGVINVAVVGAGGYSGAELVEILLGHPGARVVGVFGSARREGEKAPEALSAVFPRFHGRCDLPLRAFSVEETVACGAGVVFLATPHEASMDAMPALRERGLKVFDLSAAFRLKDAALYPKFYGFEHHAPAMLKQAVYGLPELYREEIRKADAVAVPGCYPTSAILALAPLVRAGAVRAGTRPIVDSVSGVSGAGRSLSLRSMFCEVSVQAYGVLTHRHGPEIDAYAGTPVVFTPHLGPYERGIQSTMHVELAAGWDNARVRELYERNYAKEPFVRVLAKGSWPAVNDVRGTNFCDIGFAVDEANSHLIVCSAIDNLVKGAAGQAVQCMNLRCGLDETMGLGGKTPAR